MLASNPTNRLHCQHSPTTCFESKQAAHQAHWRGSILDADPPAQGVKIARRMTEANPLVIVPGNCVVTSLSPTFAGREATLCRLYSHMAGTPVWQQPSNPFQGCAWNMA